MPAPKKNQFWKLRSKHGRDRKFTTPEELWNAACEYFETVEKNPLKEQKVFGTGLKTSVNKKRPFTLGGLCVFMGINQSTWNEYRDVAELKAMVEQIEQVIYIQKFEGAAAGLFNANIISRELGLKDASDLTTDGKSLNDAFSRTISEVRKNLKLNQGEES